MTCSTSLIKFLTPTSTTAQKADADFVACVVQTILAYLGNKDEDIIVNDEGQKKTKTKKTLIDRGGDKEFISSKTL